MTAAVPPSVAAQEFVQRLLNTERADRRRALVDRCLLEPEQLKQAIQQLLDEAVKLYGADPPRMERICADAAPLAERTGDEFLQAMVIKRQGDAARAQGRNAESCAFYDEAAAAFTRLNYPVEAARTRWGWMEATARLGRLPEALAAARSARRILEAHGETGLIAALDVSTANAHNEHGQHSRALRYFSAALRRFLTLGEAGQLQAARCYAGLGSALGLLGRHREALEKLELARATYAQAGEAAGTARVYRHIGLTHMSLGRYTAALNAFETARPLFRALHLDSAFAALAFDTAECYLYLNRPDDALAVLDRFRPELEAADDALPILGAATRRIAAYLLLGRSDEALKAIDEADHRFPSGLTQHRAWLAVQRAGAEFHNGCPDRAVQAARRAREVAASAGLRRLVAEALLTESAACLVTNATTEARRLANRAHRIAREIGAAPLLSRTYELQGQIAEATGRSSQAGRQYAASIEQLEREQRGVIFEFRDAFAAVRGVAYERLAKLQLRAGRPEEAFATAERAKSRALTDAIADNVQLRPRGGPVSRRITRELTRAREDYAARHAAAADTDPSNGRAKIDELESTIVRLVQQLQLTDDSSESADLYGATPTARLRGLAPGTALVEYFFSGDDILRLRVDVDGVQGDVLEGAVTEAERLLRVFRLNLDATERAGPLEREVLALQARAVLSRLYGRLLGDLPGLDQYRSLVIVPHGILHYLPFHALHDGDRYLVERLPISYAPSAALFDICRSRRPRRRGALVLGHSAGGRLPFTLEEAREVAEVLATPSYGEATATRALLETEGRRAALIHIAAHGEFRADAPLFSHIQLADGPLTTADVFNLHLRASLVTLSACETGRSVLGGGDELAGLTRAFLYAGAAALLVSQWRVDDASTSVLMARFYRELMRGAGRASALRAAQIASVTAAEPGSGRSHPFFWAGFQIIGDNHRIMARPRRA